MILMLTAVFVLSGCGDQASISPTISHTPVPAGSPVPTRTDVPTNSPTVFVSPSQTPSSTITPPAEPAECRKPPDDYELVEINGMLLNRRTLSMLEYAQSLYEGEIEITGYAITQGSFNDNGAASFGTHLGGGAVDLSVMRTYTYTVLYDEIPSLLQALRLAGFAAWLREPDEVYPGSAIHIHAIAIGDRDLSDAAQAQLTGESGYFRGYSGLPAVNGTPTADRFGGPVICQWMRDLGYEDLRPAPTATEFISP